MPLTLLRNGFPEPTYFTFSYSRLRDEAGESGLLSPRRDHGHRSCRQKFRAMADSIAHIVYTHAPDGTVTWANSRWYDYTGLPHIDRPHRGGLGARRPARGSGTGPRSARARVSRRRDVETEIRIKPYGHGDDSCGGTSCAACRCAHPTGRSPNGRQRDRRARPPRRRRCVGTALRPRACDVARLSERRVAADAAYIAGLDVRRDLWSRADRRSSAAIGTTRSVPDGGRVSIGDVVGRGSRAAITMVNVRQAIRGAAQVLPIRPRCSRPPTGAAFEHPDRYVTAFLGVILIR